MNKSGIALINAYDMISALEYMVRAGQATEVGVAELDYQSPLAIVKETKLSTTGFDDRSPLQVILGRPVETGHTLPELEGGPKKPYVGLAAELMAVDNGAILPTPAATDSGLVKIRNQLAEAVRRRNPAKVTVMLKNAPFRVTIDDPLQTYIFKVARPQYNILQSEMQGPLGIVSLR